MAVRADGKGWVVIGKNVRRMQGLLEWTAARPLCKQHPHVISICYHESYHKLSVRRGTDRSPLFPRKCVS